MPDCKCHGEPTRWVKDPRKRAGGYWICVVKRRAQDRKWRAKHPTNENPAVKRARNARLNPRRLHVGRMYLGMAGFTEHETKEMIEHGKTE